jgi:cyclophilin family peptidyl-prolyl cis-trans isomerase
MAHKRKGKDKKKEYVSPRTDSSHRKELRRYQRRNQRIIFFTLVAVIVAAIIVVPVALFIYSPFGGPLLDRDGSSIIDLGEPPKKDQDDIDVGDDDDDIPPYTGDKPRVTINVNNYGSIVLELYPDKAPITVDNFLRYADDGFYNGLIFHRVIKGFMIQGGGFNPDMVQKDTMFPPIKNEALESGLTNTKYSISMARTSDPDSATSQFFINTMDNPSLDPSGGEAGYAVFGRVISGTGVVDDIENVPTTSDAGHQDVPIEDVVISSVTVQV